MKIIDSHAHVVQYIAGMGAGGELRSIGDGMARYANGQVVRMIPRQFHTDSVTPEQLLEIMDQNGVEKAILLQGNFYGYQNYYTYEAVKKYPHRFAGAASYDPYSKDRDGIRNYLFEELGFGIEKFEVSTGSGLMSIHPDFRIDSDLMDEAFSYANEKKHVLVIDIGKCGSDSWQIHALRREVLRYPTMKFVACHLLSPSNQDEARLEEALKLLRLPNLWFDLASVVHNCRADAQPYSKALHYVELARDVVGTDKLMFGTDMPSALKEDEYGCYIEYINRSKRLTDREKVMIFYENANEVFFNH
ncbi:amidohydrolase family protein [Lacrimispora sp.]|uniref:amidohydrolase family protein n=1 Tax=Lacrimispora sp. TaxID=2719234 RepID=UPI0032E3DD5A